MNKSVQFGKRLTEAIHLIKSFTGQSIAGIQIDLGAALGCTSGTIAHWRAGHLPPDPETRAQLARLLIEKANGRLDRQWLLDFLKSGRYPEPEAACLEIFPMTAVGTTPPIFVESEAAPHPLQTGQDYFFIKVAGMQLAYVGEAWAGMEEVAITAVVDWSEMTTRVWQTAVAVKAAQTEQLGHRPVLIDCQPAQAEPLQVRVDWHTPPRPHPLLQFTADFYLADQPVSTGYYALLGAVDGRYPWPNKTQWPHFEVIQEQLLLAGDSLLTTPYVLLKIGALPARTRRRGQQTTWHQKFVAAEAIAEEVSMGLVYEEEAREAAWQRCKALLREGHAWLAQDPNYWPWEVKVIWQKTAAACRDRCRGVQTLRHYQGVDPTPELLQDLEELGIDAREDLWGNIGRYKEKEAAAGRILHFEQLLPKETP